MTQPNADLAALALHFDSRREAILQAWRTALRKDPRLTTSDALPRKDLYDHIPALLVNFVRALKGSQVLPPMIRNM
jgi:hypothetical protein